MKFVAIEKEEGDDNHNDKSYSRENSDEQYEHTLDSEWSFHIYIQPIPPLFIIRK